VIPTHIKINAANFPFAAINSSFFPNNHVGGGKSQAEAIRKKRRKCSKLEEGASAKG
jgi:hypothetical protein